MPGWRRRPVLAAALRALLLLAPAAVAVLTAVVLVRLGARTGLGGGTWLLVSLVGAVVAFALADVALRRHLPLVGLLEITELADTTSWMRARPPRRSRELLRGMLPARTARLVSGWRHTSDPGSPGGPAAAGPDLLAHLHTYDPATWRHSVRVQAITDLLAAELRIPRAERDRLAWAALLHDIGKLRVDRGVLSKPDALTATEARAIARHPREGARLARAVTQSLGPWAATIEQHHERYDGRGYPRRLAGEEICLGARIVAVADAYDVMTAGRPYARALRPQAARRELVAHHGSQFDPQVVRALLSVSAPRLGRAAGLAGWVGHLPFVGGAPTPADIDAVGDNLDGPLLARAAPSGAEEHAAVGLHPAAHLHPAATVHPSAQSSHGSADDDDVDEAAALDDDA